MPLAEGVKIDVTNLRLFQSIARHIETILPGYNVYINPNQQHTKLPCFFVQFVNNNNIVNDTVSRDKRFLRTFFIDLIYMNDYNLTNLYTEYAGIADILDANLQFIPYIYNTSDEPDVEKTTLIRTYQRNYNINLDALHYRFTVKLHTYLDDGIDYPDLNNMDLDVIVKEYPKDWIAHSLGIGDDTISG